MERQQKVLRLVNSPESPLTEQQIVEATVAFANGERLDIDGLVSDMFGKSGDAKIEEALAIVGALEERRSAGSYAGPRTVEEARKNASARTARALSEILRDRSAAAKTYVGKGLEEVIPVKPVLRVTLRGLLFSLYYAFPTFLHLIWVGEILLADAGRGYSDKLCQCQFSGCGRFFFERKPPTGRPQRRYCSREHMLKAHDESAAERMARKRPARRGK